MTTLADSFLADLDELDDNTIDVHLRMEEDKYENLAFNYHDDYDLDNFLKLQKSRHYIDTMQKVEHALIFANKGDVLLEYDDPEYKLIVDCNALSVDIDDEIDVIHNFIRDKGLLPSAVIMVVTVTASTTNGKPLPERVLERTLEECDRILDLDSSKKKVVDFVESRMKYIAPNLYGVVGSAVAAKLMCCAGGLMLLANMPSYNIRCLGARRKNLAGTPPSLRGKVRKILADKCSLAGRVDLSKTGRIDFKEKICKKIEKLHELPPARLPKALPVPDFTSRKKTGGRRHRKRKERYQVTDAQKLRNRMQFRVPEESSLGDGIEVGYGMHGQAGSGRLRISARQSKKIAKISEANKSYGSTGAFTSGLSSSLAFTPVQGIELVNHQAHSDQLGSGTQSTYFSETGTFSKIKGQKALSGV
ncbi:U4/U6 small nuclear ribonucleoprotein Prp31 [Capsicum chacoense]